MSMSKQVLIQNVPVDNQYPELPTGCEATALSMLLRWSGLKTDKYTVADKLDKGDKVHEINGKWYGANPNEKFVGDPYTESGSYGVFEQPILQVIEYYLPGKGVNLTGKPFSDLLAIIEKGIPVVVWTTLKQRESYYHKSWKEPGGQTIDWYNNEHAVTMVGYDDATIIVHDPDTGGREFYDRPTFLINWEALGMRAVSLNI